MDKEKIFSKLNSKDYNNELEKILENKDFSENVKNLLLSMLYKIEAGYKDYITVKRMVESKKTCIEEILKIVEEKCNKIEIVGEDSKESKEIEETGTHFLVDKIEGNILLMYPNEKLLLYTIYKLDDKQVYLDEKYNLIRIALSELLNSGENINNIEVLRDFNGWSWNTDATEIPEIKTNMIYQNLIYLLGIELVKEWVHTNQVKDYIEVVQNRLKELYGETNAKELLKLIYKISIINCTEKNNREKERLLEEKEELEKELNKLEDKRNLLNEISKSKKETLRNIGEIDAIINDKKLLEKEYIKRNENRPEYNKIFSLSHLVEILTKQRKKLMSKMEEANKLLDPGYYIKIKQNIEEQLDLLQDIELRKYKDRDSKTYKYIIELQKEFIKCMQIKLDSVKEKEEMIDLICTMRYYNYLYVNEEKQIKDTKELKYELTKLENNIIEKACKLKVINRLSNDEETNNSIIKNIFITKIIDIENMNIELKLNEKALEIDIYDTDVFEKTVVIPSFDKNDLTVKLNKRIKVLI